MKKILLSLSVAFIGSLAINAQSVSVNTDGSTADASSILDIKSTTKGMLAPRMTTAQRTAIVAPASGLLVYDTDVKSFWYYNGTAWTNVTGNSGFTLPYSKISVVSNSPLFDLTNTASNGLAIKGTSYLGHGILGVTYSDNAHAGIRGDATGNGSAGVRGSSSNATGVGVDAVNTGGGVALNVNGNLKIAGGNTNPGNGAILTSDATGNARWQGPVAFKARGLLNSGAGNIPPGDKTKIMFLSENHDFGNDFDIANSYFIVPQKGLYHIDARADWEWAMYILASIELILERNGTKYTLTNGEWHDPDGEITAPTNLISTDFILEAGDKLWIEVYQTNLFADYHIVEHCSFNGHLIYRM